MNDAAASCEVSDISPPSRGGDEREGVEYNIHHIPSPYPPPSRGRILFVNPEAALRGIL
jgi:hypothetical protein